MTIRKIIHIDMDAFYASVALREKPELHDKPVVVAHDKNRSVICAASYTARRYGIHSAMPTQRAKHLCPQLILIPPQFELYKAISAQIHDIFLQYTDTIEPLSLDEAYLDVSANISGFPSATATAKDIRQTILKETQLTASAGIAPNKFLAKIASDWQKPNGQFTIAPSQVLSFVHLLPVQKIPGVGKVTLDKLHGLGIKTLSDISTVDKEILLLTLGQFGHRLLDFAQGIDLRAVKHNRERKQISCERTLDEDQALPQLKQYILPLAETLYDATRKKRISGSCLTLKLKSQDFKTITRSQSFSSPLNSIDDIERAAYLLMEKIPRTKSLFRLMGLGLSQLTSNTHKTLLWDE